MEAVKKGHCHRHDARDQSFFRDIDGFTQVEKNAIVEWWPWAMAYHHNMSKMYPDVPKDVLYDGAIDALIYSVREWDPNGGKTFKGWFHVACSMFTTRCIKRWKRDFLCQDSGDRCVRGSRKKVDGDNLYLRDTLDFGTTQWEDQVIDKIMLDEILCQLTPKQREIMERVYIYNEKQSDVARALGVTRQNVNLALKETMTKCHRISSGEEVRRGPKKGARSGRKEQETAAVVQD